MKETIKKLLGITGAAAAVVCLPLMFLSISAFLGDPGHTPRVVLGALAASFGGLAVAGAWLALRNLRRPRPADMSDLDREQAILRLATQTDGRVTVAEVAARCRMTINDAKAALEQMCTQGAAEVLFADDGSIVYEFKGLLSDSQRKGASDPLLSELRRSNVASRELDG